MLMKRFVFITVILLLGLAACSTSGENTPSTQGQKISLEEAHTRIAALAPNRDIQIEEITTATLWDEMGVQLYTNVSQEQYEYVFAIAGDRTLVLKDAWGAYYFEYVLADLDRDGQKEMLYAYDWGSGIVRTRLGVLKADGSQEEITQTKEAEGLWAIRSLKAEGNTVTCEASSLGGSPTVKGICTYTEDGYLFDIEK